jgi:hypothetical protein
MIHSYVKFSEFERAVTKHTVFHRIRFFQPSPQEAPVLPEGTKVIGEMRFTCAVGQAVKVFLRQQLFKNDNPTDNPEKERFSIEFKMLCKALSDAGCDLIVGEVGDTILSGEIDNPGIVKAIDSVVEKLDIVRRETRKATEGYIGDPEKSEKELPFPVQSKEDSSESPQDSPPISA